MSTEAYDLLRGWVLEDSTDRRSATRPEDPVARRRELTLIHAAQRGSHEAFRELVEWHQDRIYRFCLLRAITPEDAEEICQDTFVRAYEALPRWKPKAQFSTWLYKIANNLARDRFRARSSRNARQTDSLDNVCSETTTPTCHRAGPDENLSRAEDIASVEAAISTLSRRSRETILLNAVEGLSYKECALVVGCSVRAFEGRIYRARQELLAACERKNS